MKEEWKAVPEYEGLYEASNYGRIRSLARKTTSGRVLKQYVNSVNGYCYVSLSKDNVIKQKRVHRLVYHAFTGTNPPGRYDKNATIDHIDGDKTNNKLDNLEMCTQSENQKRAFALGINGKASRKVVDLTTGNVFNSLFLAAKSVGGKKSSAISRVCYGKRSQYRDHKFAFYEDYLSGNVPQFMGKSKNTAVTLWR